MADVEAIRTWLEGLKLERYLEQLLAAGLGSLERLEHLTDADLDAAGITLAGHRTRILKNPPNKRLSQRPQSDAFGDVLGNMDDLVGELEGLTSKTATLLKTSGDRDLDSILEDLCSFGLDDMPAAEPQPDLPPKLAPRAPAAAPPIVSEPPPPALAARAPVAAPQGPTEDEHYYAAPTPRDDPPPPARGAPSTAPTLATPADLPPTSRTSVAGAAPSPAPAQVPMRPKNAAEIQQRLSAYRKEVQSQLGTVSATELDNLMKEEKIRIAMEKLANASRQQLILKIFLDEATCKTLAVDTSQSARHVANKMVVKCRLEDDPYYAIVEKCPELGVRRQLEDHESVGDAFQMWPPTCNYRFELLLDQDKYGLFLHPDRYFPTHMQEDLSEASTVSERTERAKRVLLQEYFSSTHRIPDIKGYLHERADGSKKWKRKYFMLRSSGLYYSTKGESEASKDLVCFLKFDEYDFCLGTDWKKECKAPTDSCMCFRPRLRKRVIAREDMKALCCPDEVDLNRWWAGIRLAQHGTQLRDNYEETLRKLEQLSKLGKAVPAAMLSSAQSVRRAPIEETNKDLIDQWKESRRSKKHPMMSAATGVRWDEPDEPRAPAPTPTAPSGPSLTSSSWFVGPIPRNKAEDLLSPLRAQEGCFLVRDSTSHKGDFVLSVTYQHNIHHFHIRTWPAHTGTEYSIDDGPRFPDLPALIQFYHKKDQRLPCVLTRSVMG
eukprot:m.195076 g.195076  ORF g.195076 m.195076 type:complete len:719 (+) comp18309_c0_seq2:273-2429(+)